VSVAAAEYVYGLAVTTRPLSSMRKIDHLGGDSAGPASGAASNAFGLVVYTPCTPVSTGAVT
jgi:hypothetical protein